MKSEGNLLFLDSPWELDHTKKNTRSGKLLDFASTAVNQTDNQITRAARVRIPKSLGG